MALSFNQRQKFRSQPEQVVEEFKLGGGLVTDIHETKLDPSQSPNLQDVIFDTTANLKTRNGYLRYNGNPVGIASDQSNTGASAGTVELDATGDWVGQTFQPSGAMSVTQIDLYLAMETSGDEQYFQAQLWSTSGSAPSAILTNGTGQTKLVSGTSETAYSFRFRRPVALSAATTYAIILKPVVVQSTVQTIKHVLVHRTGAAYANGEIYTSTDSGLNWAAAGNDLKFVVYSGGDTGSTGLVRFYGDSGVQQSLAKFGTGIYRGNDSNGAMTTISMGNSITPSSADYWDYTVSNGTLLLVDNSNRILKYRGSTNATYTTGTVSVTDGSATVTGSGTSWSTVTNAEVGEYIKLPDGKWYKIASIASNTSLTIELTYYGDTASGQTYIISPWGVVEGRFNDGAAAPTSEAPSGLVRPTPEYIENHINRIWTLNGNSLRFSALDTSISGEHFNDWDTGSNAGQILIPFGKGDSGTGLYSLNNSLYVFGRRSIWGVYGNSPSNFELRNVTNEIGMISKRTLVEWNDLLVFQSDFGIYLFDGSNLKNISEQVVNTLIDDWANKTSPVATLWDNKYVISYTSDGGSYNDSALFYDLQVGTWWKIANFYASAWMSWAGGTDDGRLYFASSNQGSFYRWDTGSHDDGYAIESLYDTPSINFGSGMNDKALKRFYLQQLALGDWNMSITMYTNISETTTSGSAINLTTGSNALWDVAQWDVDSWSGEGALITTRVAEFQGQGKYFKFRFAQTGYSEGYEILGLTGTARPRRLT